MVEHPAAMQREDRRAPGLHAVGALTLCGCKHGAWGLPGPPFGQARCACNVPTVRRSSAYMPQVTTFTFSGATRTCATARCPRTFEGRAPSLSFRAENDRDCLQKPARPDDGPRHPPGSMPAVVFVLLGGLVPIIVLAALFN
jgi:hypothetical protein